MSKVPRSPGTPVLDNCEPPPECWGLNPDPLGEQSVLLNCLQLQGNLKTFFFFYFCLRVNACVSGVRACISAVPTQARRGPGGGALELGTIVCSLYHHGCWGLNSWSSSRAVYFFQLYGKLFALVIYIVWSSDLTELMILKL